MGAAIGCYSASPPIKEALQLPLARSIPREQVGAGLSRSYIPSGQYDSIIVIVGGSISKLDRKLWY
jgi:hypothetical protein